MLPVSICAIAESSFAAHVASSVDDVILIAIAAILGRAKCRDGIKRHVTANREWLKSSSVPSYCIPLHDTLSRVFRP